MWPVSYDDYTCVPKFIEICEAFYELSSGNNFSGLGHSDLDPDSSNPNIKLDLNLVKFRSYFVPKLVKICEAFYEFSSRNHEN